MRVFYFKYKMLFAIVSFLFALLITLPFNTTLFFKGIFILIAVVMFSVPSFFNFIVVEDSIIKRFLIIHVWEITIDSISGIVAMERIDIDKPTLFEIGKNDPNYYYLVNNNGRKFKIGSGYYIDANRQSIIEIIKKLTNKKIQYKKKYIIFQ
jgi:hypothetical protein